MVETMDDVLKTALEGPLPVSPPPGSDDADITDQASGTRH